MRDVSDLKGTFSMPDRQRVMRDLIDFGPELYARDIQHCDLHPRNVIIAANDAGGNGKDDSTAATAKVAVPSIAIVDFGSAEFGRIQMVPAPAPDGIGLAIGTGRSIWKASTSNGGD